MTKLIETYTFRVFKNTFTAYAEGINLSEAITETVYELMEVHGLEDAVKVETYEEFFSAVAQNLPGVSDTLQTIFNISTRDISDWVRMDPENSFITPAMDELVHPETFTRFMQYLGKYVDEARIPKNVHEKILTLISGHELSSSEATIGQYVRFFKDLTDLDYEGANAIHATLKLFFGVANSSNEDNKRVVEVRNEDRQQSIIRGVLKKLIEENMSESIKGRSVNSKAIERLEAVAANMLLAIDGFTFELNNTKELINQLAKARIDALFDSNDLSLEMKSFFKLCTQITDILNSYHQASSIDRDVIRLWYGLSKTYHTDYIANTLLGGLLNEPEQK